ncbi:MAG: DUF3817 domain-containing protein [Gordonia sp. (in: high G+C Gram-positive bacteria)]|uniref:DUF3817 domain-containing protein n=1 Tax=Gordonia sp. (in: high G+C Gram-positive bacteria) TaxID=84139 RepID=UPI0039E3CF25
MKNLFDVSTPARLFRLVAVIEAITWALLILGMIAKYAGGMESATMIPGSLHGAAFIAYLVVTVYASRKLGWSLPTTGLALVASIPPFFSLVFEWWAARNGRLAELSAPVADEQTVDTLKA